MYFLSTVSVVTLMLSLTAVAPTPDDCVHLNATLSAVDLHKIFGKWILHEVYALNSHDNFSRILKTINSDQTEFIPSQNNHTVIFKQAYMRDETCIRHSGNFTVVGNTIQHTSTTHNYTFEADFLKTCDDCLSMRYSTVHDGKKRINLLVYGKTLTLPQADQEKAKEQAECLGFLQPPEFTYKQAEFCPETSDATTESEEPEQ